MTSSILFYFQPSRACLPQVQLMFCLPSGHLRRMSLFTFPLHRVNMVRLSLKLKYFQGFCFFLSLTSPANLDPTFANRLYTCGPIFRTWQKQHFCLFLAPSVLPSSILEDSRRDGEANKNAVFNTSFLSLSIGQILTL